jgi:hypothetical protein
VKYIDKKIIFEIVCCSFHISEPYRLYIYYNNPTWFSLLVNLIYILNKYVYTTQKKGKVFNCIYIYIFWICISVYILLLVSTNEIFCLLYDQHRINLAQTTDVDLENKNSTNSIEIKKLIRMCHTLHTGGQKSTCLFLKDTGKSI